MIFIQQIYEKSYCTNCFVAASLHYQNNTTEFAENPNNTRVGILFLLYFIFIMKNILLVAAVVIGANLLSSCTPEQIDALNQDLGQNNTAIVMESPCGKVLAPLTLNNPDTDSFEVFLQPLDPAQLANFAEDQLVTIAYTETGSSYECNEDGDTGSIRTINLQSIE